MVHYVELDELCFSNISNFKPGAQLKDALKSRNFWMNLQNPFPNLVQAVLNWAVGINRSEDGD